MSMTLEYLALVYKIAYLETKLQLALENGGESR